MNRINKIISEEGASTTPRQATPKGLRTGLTPYHEDEEHEKFVEEEDCSLFVDLEDGKAVASRGDQMVFGKMEKKMDGKRRFVNPAKIYMWQFFQLMRGIFFLQALLFRPVNSNDGLLLVAVENIMRKKKWTNFVQLKAWEGVTKLHVRRMIR